MTILAPSSWAVTEAANPAAPNPATTTSVSTSHCGQIPCSTGKYWEFCDLEPSRELGAISAAALDSANTMEGIVARRAFWRTANATLARFSDRIDASLEGTIRAALQG